MARVRSPNYPSISLPAALERIRKVHKMEGRNEVSRESFVQILGYSGLNGPSGKILSSIGKYGLVDKVGPGEITISELAMNVMFGEADQKAKAIERAAKTPTLFAEIGEKWPDRQPSDELLRSFLARKNFSIKVLDKVISAYRDTMSLISESMDGDDSEFTRQDNHKKKIDVQPQGHSDGVKRELAHTTGEPFRMSITGSCVEVVAKLETVQQANELIRALNIAKTMITPIGTTSKVVSGDEEDSEIKVSS